MDVNIFLICLCVFTGSFTCQDQFNRSTGGDHNYVPVEVTELSLRSSEPFTPNNLQTSTDSDNVSERTVDIIDWTLGSFEEYTASCQNGSENSSRICGCSQSCRLLNNCCYDSPFRDTATAWIGRNLNYSCYESFGVRWALLSSILVDGCPTQWKDDRKRRLCENPDEDNAYSYIPCVSKSSGISFRNIYCLECNNLNDSVLWTVTFQSSRRVPFRAIDNMTKMTMSAGERPLSRRGLQFVVIPPKGFKSAHCTPSVIGHCRSEFDSGMMTASCQSYYNPVIVARKLYRNIHCFLCNTGSTLADVTIQQIRKDIPTSMSVLLFFDNSEPKDTNIASTKQATLVPIRVRGYYEDKLLFFRTSRKDVNTTRLLKLLCKNMIVETLKDKLAPFNTKMLQLLDSPQSKELPVVRVGVLILDDIPVSQTSIVGEAFESLAFGIHTVTGIYLECCFNKLDTQEKTSKPPVHTQENSTKSAKSRQNSTNTVANLSSSCNPPLFGIIIMLLLLKIPTLP